MLIANRNILGLIIHKSFGARGVSRMGVRGGFQTVTFLLSLMVIFRSFNVGTVYFR